MKSKPVVMEHFSTIHTSYVVNFIFTNNITILTGKSASGKTASFSFMKECMALDRNFKSGLTLHEKHPKPPINRLDNRILLIL